MNKGIFIAHFDDCGTVQSVSEHSRNTAMLSSRNSIVELADICYSAGMLHDIGKYQKSFQKRIQGEPIQVEHSIAGAKEALAEYGQSALGMLLALCIAGHHSGIPDFGGRHDLPETSSLFGRLQRKCETYDIYRQELDLKPLDNKRFEAFLTKDCQTKEELLEAYALLVRYCFSCLTDADTLDTMQATGQDVPTPLSADFSKCKDILEEQFSSFSAVTDLQKARTAIQNQAFRNIGKDSDLYLMGMPTGSGKTLASMECGLIRALKTGKKRIIYVIPYNSIIDQTVQEFESLFAGHAQILRHQSSFSYEDQQDIEEDYRKSAIFACENWDAQIIVTTAVQFFESVYSNKRGRLRKLHNMAESVLIFDEAHLMPIDYLQPCLRAVAVITKYLHSEAIFLTATMPDFEKLLKDYALKSVSITNLVPDHSEFHHFKKNKYTDIGVVSDEALIERAKGYASSLIVVNTRKAAKALFEQCVGKKYHLSTYMTAGDRTKVIDKIKQELLDMKQSWFDLSEVPVDKRITVIATSLIEAGVDLDFMTAFRELNGLDNVLQTGGRCNREGYYQNGDVFIFERKDSKRTQSPQQNILKGIMAEHEDISSGEAIRDYYGRLYALQKDDISKHSLSKMCNRLDSIPFRTYSAEFHMIESGAVSVVIPQDDYCRNIIDQGRYSGFIPARKIQKYCCTIYPNELQVLMNQHVIEEIGSTYILTNEDYYNSSTGIQFEGQDIYF